MDKPSIAQQRIAAEYIMRLYREWIAAGRPRRK